MKKRRNLSLGDRIVFINSVLSNLPIYFLSFIKAPRKVSKEIILIQRGGLGIKDIHLFNLSLLGKWLWRIVKGEKGLWFEVLSFRYGLENSGFVNNTGTKSSHSSSVCWRDLCSVEDESLVPKGWLKAGLSKKIGNGGLTSLWNDTWIGIVSLKEKYSRLFLVSDGRNAKVDKVGRWEGDLWVWNFNWRRIFFEWEDSMVQDFVSFLSDAKLIRGQMDDWGWKYNSAGQYSCKTAYCVLIKNSCTVADPNRVFVDEFFKKFWLTTIPLKILAFGW